MVTVELPAMSPAVMAAAWIAALSRTRVSTQEIEAFFGWREDPVNDAAFAALCHVPDSAPRFVAVGAGSDGDVIDVWTGGRAWLAERVGEPLTAAKAHRMAAMLNERQLSERSA